MPYPALPDHRIPYDNDGTLVYTGTFGAGATTLASGATLLEWQDDDYATAGGNFDQRNANTTGVIFLFFPAQTEVTAVYAHAAGGGADNGPVSLSGSNDTTNGLDGTWETASLPDGSPGHVNNFSWRDGIKAVSFTGPKKNLRVVMATSGSGGAAWEIVHLYGEVAAGQMAHDLVFINHDDTPGVAFTAPEDFGDQPLGTTVVRQFRVKNTSATKTATNINIQCNDPDFVISDVSGAGPWVVTINIASLGPGAESGTLWVRCTTPAPGAALKPRFARIIATCDAGFFG